MNRAKHSSFILSTLTLLAFATLVYAGIFDCANPIMQSRMNMTGSHHMTPDCIPGQNCGMDLSEHVAVWQSMIAATLAVNGSGWILIILAAVVVFVVFNHLSAMPRAVSRFLFYARGWRDARRYNYLLPLFSDGILQPKLYA